MSRNIIICSGGSGGHVFPALSLYAELKKDDENSVFFLTDVRGSIFIEKIDTQVNVSILPNIKASLKCIPDILKTIFKSIDIFLEQKPDLIICFGGIATIIPSLIAKMFDVKIFIHEQNAVTGKANRFLIKYIHPNKIMTSFKETSLLPKNSNTVHVGYPLLKTDLQNYNKSFDLNKITILIIAGSQGSYIFDQIIPNIVIKAISNIHGIEFHVIQQTKKENINKISELYDNNKIKNTISDFFNNIPELMISSDLLIARSGAGTIFEIIKYKIPSIVIPLKNAADNHQKVNAEQFGGFIDLVEEDNIDILQKKLISIFNKPDILGEKYNKLRTIQSENALQNISELINKEFEQC